jgi:predicted CXXCH cytochrome family protein
LTRFKIVLVVAIALSMLVIGVGLYLYSDYRWTLPKSAVATYVGRDACIECHQDQANQFKDSHHDLAMARATSATVLGNFDNQSLEHHGVVSRMFRDGERFMVHTEGPDGKLADFEVQYVFGVDPLQQYMVEITPPADNSTQSAGPNPAVGRLQVLRISWDTAKKSWFYLDPPDVKDKLAPDDPLHWTGVAQRWNSMCADCHSTNLQKNFQVAENRYHTTFSEIDVSCESCHGPGSLHVQLAKRKSFFWDSERGFALAKLKASPEKEIQACAPCHARREIVFPGFDPTKNYFDHYLDQSLFENVFYADGQQQDEDYIHASFLQSKMYHKGIKCTDCHDPHTSRLKHDGNQVCTSCHQHPGGKYDTPAHHFHKPGTKGASCVDCHMLETTYMAIDPRRDHSFRIPRPDLSLKIDSPNSCASCHLDQGGLSAEKMAKLPLYQDWMLAAEQGDEEVKQALLKVNQWCDAACEKWYGANRKKDRHFGEALYAVRKKAPDSVEQLKWLLEGSGPQFPAIARATGLREAIRLGPETAAQLARNSLRDESPFVRAAAAAAHDGSGDPNLLTRRLVPLLRDPIRSVRVEAARVLVLNGITRLSGTDDAALANALEEYKIGLNNDGDRAGAHLTLGALAEQLGNAEAAEKEYRIAIALEPSSSGGRANLAALLGRQMEQLAQDPAALSRLSALQQEVDSLRAEELKLLKRDADLLPGNGNLQYRVGLALYLAGEHSEAEKRLQRAVDSDPTDVNFLMALVLLQERLNKLAEAEANAKKLYQLAPNSVHEEILKRIQSLKGS